MSTPLDPGTTDTTPHLADPGRRMVEADSDCALILLDSEGCVTSWNLGAERTTGYTAPEIIGQHFAKFFPPEEIASGKPQQVLAKALVEGSYEEETLRLRKDGSSFPAAVTVTSLFDALRRPMGYASLTRDLTQLRKERQSKLQLEAAMRACEARYHTLFEYSQVGVVLADTESYYVDANQSACRMLGYSREELVGLHARDIVAGSEVAHIGPALSELNGQTDHQRQWMFRRKDRTVFPAHVIATQMPDGTLLGMIRDISDKQQAEAYRERLAAIVESSQDAIIGVDLNGIVTSWNAGAESIFEYPASEMVGTPLSRLLPEDRKDEERRIAAALERGERKQLAQTQRRAKDGRLIDVSIAASPIRDGSGRIVGASRIARDITELMEREREVARLSRLYEALSQVNQAIVWTSTREELLQKICRVLCEHGGFDMAWVGWHDAQTHRLNPVAVCGDEKNYLQGIQVYVDDRPEGLGPSGLAFRSGRPCINNDSLNNPATQIWRSELERRGLHSSAAIPIRLKGEVCGILSVYASKGDFFHDKEIALLEEAAVDISYALDNFENDQAREEAERKLRGEKLFSDTMIESMPGILYFYDGQGKFLRWNRNFETVSGYSGPEIAGMHPLDFFSAADKPLLARRIAEVFEKGESFVEAAFLAKDGTSTPYFFTGRNVPFEDKVCLVGVGIDVSERQRAQDSLAESEQKYRELVEYANSIIMRWNAEGRITLLNEYGQRFFGYTAEEILGRHVMDTIVPPTESGGRDLRRLMEEICADPQAFEQNINENMRRNGQRAWISWTNRIVCDANGQVTEILSIGTDITERKRAEEARQESEARYRKLFECAPDGIVIADRENYCLDVNPSLCQMLGYAAQELKGLHVSTLFDPSELPQIEPVLVAPTEAHEHSRDRRFRRKDGTALDVEVIAATMPDGNLMGMARDITERKQAEAEREKRLRAEAADRIKSAFLATMSHELRTPLNSIIGFTGIILQGMAGPLNPEQSKQLDMVRTSARHLLALVNDVLDISKIEAGQLQVALEPIDARRSIQKVLGLVKPQIEAKRLRFGIQVDPDLGEVVADERRFEQVLLNLLSNAIKFTEQGEVALVAEIVPSFKLEGETSSRPALRVRVSDSGIGIKPSELPTLFQPFKQIDSGLARKHDGTGLGLAISRRLATLMGGEITAQSEWGKGSTFSFTLPLKGPVKE